MSLPTTESINPWIKAAQGYVPVPAPKRAPVLAANGEPRFVAAHGGAGSTSWANILGGVDGGSIAALGEQAAPTVLVARASIDGVDAAKTAIALHGYTRFACVLLVPAMGGKPARIITDEIKVLSGALPIVHVPWVPSLLARRVSELTTTSIPVKELPKIITALAAVGIHLQGATS